MRALLPAALLLALVAATPPASAGRATLVVDGPLEPMDILPGNGTTVPLSVLLRLEEFACFEEAEFRVQLEAAASGPATARLSTENVSFRIPEDSYLLSDYRNESEVRLRIDGTGNGEATVTVAALLFPDNDRCISPDDFPTTRASFTVHLRVGSGDEGAPANGTAAGGNGTSEGAPGNATSAGGNATGNATAPTPAMPTTTTGPPAEANASPTCPTPDCGYIGDYDPSESQEPRGVSAPALAWMLAVCVVAALAWRRLR